MKVDGATVAIDRELGPPLVPRFDLASTSAHMTSRTSSSRSTSASSWAWGQLAAGGGGIFFPGPEDNSPSYRRRAQRIGHAGRADMQRSERLVLITVAAWEGHRPRRARPEAVPGRSPPTSTRRGCTPTVRGAERWRALLRWLHHPASGPDTSPSTARFHRGRRPRDGRRSRPAPNAARLFVDRDRGHRPGGRLAARRGRPGGACLARRELLGRNTLPYAAMFIALSDPAGFGEDLPVREVVWRALAARLPARAGVLPGSPTQWHFGDSANHWGNAAATRAGSGGQRRRSPMRLTGRQRGSRGGLSDRDSPTTHGSPFSSSTCWSGNGPTVVELRSPTRRDALKPTRPCPPCGACTSTEPRPGPDLRDRRRRRRRTAASAPRRPLPTNRAADPPHLRPAALPALLALRPAPGTSSSCAAPASATTLHGFSA